MGPTRSLNLDLADAFSMNAVFVHNVVHHAFPRARFTQRKRPTYPPEAQGRFTGELAVVAEFHTIPQAQTSDSAFVIECQRVGRQTKIIGILMTIRSLGMNSLGAGRRAFRARHPRR